ncbi:MAG: sigma-54-dependent Fis family transcriptional regulator [Myxococcales bacterium]|nr:sigma-54-dependent Fis family transcriptional regulator [Myxococcales bacterium]
MVAQSAAMQAVLEKAATIAHTDASVVIRGESGCGKEVLARALHANSERRNKPFVAINCAALPAELLESELFGHVRGAFTGAHATKRGLFEEADGATLFLDEIAEMPGPLQAKLLRALQDGEVRRVGDTQPIHVDVRVLCATHQDLTAAIREKRFREDLYYRLKVFTLAVPPLRERKEDIPILAALFLQREKHASGQFTPRALALLTKYPWPGNVRELANAVKHGAVLSRGATVDAQHLPEELAEPSLGLATPGAEPLTTLAEAEKRHVLTVLKACGGQQVDAARVLGIGRTTLWRKLKEWGLDDA